MRSKFASFFLGCQPGAEYWAYEYLVNYIWENVIDALRL